MEKEVSEKIKLITGLRKSYNEWRKFLKPLMERGKLRDITFIGNYFYGLPKRKYWAIVNGSKSTFCDIPATEIILEDNIFEGSGFIKKIKKEL